MEFISRYAHMPIDYFFCCCSQNNQIQFDRFHVCLRCSHQTSNQVFKFLTVIWKIPHAIYRSLCGPSKGSFSRWSCKGSTYSVAKYKTLSDSRLSKNVNTLGCLKVFNRFTAAFAISNWASLPPFKSKTKTETSSFAP